MSANNRWSPYPDSLLDIPRDVSFFDAWRPDPAEFNSTCDVRYMRAEPDLMRQWREHVEQSDAAHEVTVVVDYPDLETRLALRESFDRYA